MIIKKKFFYFLFFILHFSNLIGQSKYELSWLPPQLSINDTDYTLTLFPVFNFSGHSAYKKYYLFNSRGLGLKYQSGNLLIYSSFFDTQVNTSFGSVGDSTLPGLNYVRFRGSGANIFEKGKVSGLDFDENDYFIQYHGQYGEIFYGKFPRVYGISSFNNLFLNGQTGSFPHLWYTYKRDYFKFESGILFLKHYNRSNTVDNKTIVFHSIKIYPTDKISVSFYEGIVHYQHDLKYEYLFPLTFLRSADHYNLSSDNAFIGSSFQFKSSKYRLYVDILIDDLETGKLFTGWFRNKIATLIGTEYSYVLNNKPNKTTFEIVIVQPYTYSHRSQNINMTHYGTSFGPLWGPNSLVFGLYHESEFYEELHGVFTGEFIHKGLSFRSLNLGDNVNVGHPEPPGNPSYEDYPKLLSGDLIRNIRVTGKIYYKYEGIKFFSGFQYNTNTTFIYDYVLRKGFTFNLGISYNFHYFDKIHPDIWK